MTSEELSSKILSEIKYIQEKYEIFQKKIVDFKLNENQLNEIRSVLNYFRTDDFAFISTLNNQKDLLNLENKFSPYKISIETFLDNPTQQRLVNFITNNSAMYKFIENITKEQSASTDSIINLNHYKRLAVDELSANHKESFNIQKEIDGIKKSIRDLQSSDTQLEITKKLLQSDQLFDKAKNSEQLIDTEIQKLIAAKERQIAYTLSEQFEKKTSSLSWPVWINFILIFFWFIVLLMHNIKYVELLLDPKIADPLFWKTMLMVLILKLPLIFLIFFNLNEYSKAKKLFEEYEHKRIMAATLVNNLERLKNELHADEKDLLELIKAPFEKIFDNPVHSIYGDKSGDKNIDLDQLKKFTDIFTKLKSDNK